MRLHKSILIVFVMLVNSSVGAKTDKIDYLNLSATLIKDGYIQRAITSLDKVDIEKQDFDFITYYTLKGIVFHKTGYPAISNIFLNASLDRGQTNKSIYLYMARNYWQRAEYEDVIKALDDAGQLAYDNPQMIAIRAESNKQLGKLDVAWRVLDEGIRLHPEYSKFLRQKFYYLLDLGYYRTAEEYANKYLEAAEYTANEYLAVAFTFRENKRYDSAAKLLELGAIKYSEDRKIKELLSQVYLDQRQYLEAALVLDWASISNSEFSHRAASLYLKSRDPVRSLQLNRRITKQDEKFRQRIAIDIHLQDYESMVAKTDVLTRYDLVSDDNIAYALGFAYFKIGDYARSKRFLKNITDNQLFNKATYLFEQIEKCQNDPFACS